MNRERERRVPIGGVGKLERLRKVEKKEIELTCETGEEQSKDILFKGGYPESERSGRNLLQFIDERQSK